MSKLKENRENKRRNQNNRNENRGNHGNGERRIPDCVEKFSIYSFKKYRKSKSCKKSGKSKKEIKKDYFIALADVLPEVIIWYLREGYKNDQTTVKIREGIDAKLSDPWFIKKLSKDIKKGNMYDEYRLLPAIYRGLFRATAKVNQERLKADAHASIYRMDDAVDLVKDVLGKTYKRLVKDGVDEELALNVCCVLPCKTIFNYSPTFRVREFFEVLYDASKGKNIPLDVLMQDLVPEERLTLFIVYVLLERKERFGNMSDNQKQFYHAITQWAFDTMNTLGRDKIHDILLIYVNTRRDDDTKGKDGNRRYCLTALSEKEYEPIVKVVKNMILQNPGIEKYLM